MLNNCSLKSIAQDILNFEWAGGIKSEYSQRLQQFDYSCIMALYRERPFTVLVCTLKLSDIHARWMMEIKLGCRV